MKNPFKFILNQYKQKWLLINIAIWIIVSIFDLYYGAITFFGLTALVVIFVWAHSIYLLFKKKEKNEKDNDKEE